MSIQAIRLIPIQARPYRDEEAFTRCEMAGAHHLRDGLPVLRVLAKTGAKRRIFDDRYAQIWALARFLSSTF